MAREGTRGASARKKSPKKAQSDDAGMAAEKSSTGSQKKSNDDNNNTAATTTTTTTTTKVEQQQPQPQHHPLARITEGMNRRSLLTGLYGTRGERIRHVVANGALLMPQETLDIMAMFEEATKNDDQDDKATTTTTSNTKNKKRKAQYQPLPGLDSVVRPTMDKSLQTIAVTDLFHKEYPNTMDPTQPPTIRTVGTNRTVNLLQSNPASSNVANNNADTERIRGGGDEDEQKQSEPTTQVANNLPTSSVVTNPVPNTSNTSANTTTSTQENTAKPVEASSSVTAPVPADSAAPSSNPTPAQPTSQPSAAANAGTATVSSTQQAPLTAAAPMAATPDAPVPAPAIPSATTAPAPSVAPVPTPAVPSAAAAPTPSVAPVPAPVPATASAAAPSPAVPSATAAPTPAPSAPVPGPAVPPATSAPKPAAPVPAPVPTASAAAPVPAPAVPSAAPSAPVPAPAPAVPSATTAPAPAPANPSTAPAEAATSKVIPLTKKPSPHWEQHIPSSNDENLTDPQAKTPKPDWYDPQKPSNLERTLLPEWFDGSASHRTEETFLKARETMIHISDQLGNRFVTSTLARRSLPGDVGSLHRLHSFLTHYLWINEEGRNDSAPTAPSLQQPPQLLTTHAQGGGSSSVWTEKRRGDLLNALVEVSQQQQHSKKRKIEETVDDPMDVDGSVEHGADENVFVPIDWDAIAEKVGASPVECEREFLAMPMEAPAIAEGERPITPDTMTSDAPKESVARLPKDPAQEELLQSLIEGTSPKVIQAVTGAALVATRHDIPAAQRAARLGLVANQVAKAAQAHEETVSRLLSEVIDQRMQKLECRMALMDDLEGILEAERVALELERRDFYTTRCRDWFGGN